MDNEKIDPQKENESLTEKIKIKKIMNGEKKGTKIKNKLFMV